MKLKPCPFCLEDVVCEDDRHQVKCMNCGARGPISDDPGTDWNKRTLDALKDRVVEAARKIIAPEGGLEYLDAEEELQDAISALDAKEDIEVLLRPLAEIPRLIREGGIRHALVVAAFWRFFMEYRSSAS